MLVSSMLSESSSCIKLKLKAYTVKDFSDLGENNDFCTDTVAGRNVSKAGASLTNLTLKDEWIDNKLLGISYTEIVSNLLFSLQINTPIRLVMGHAVQDSLVDTVPAHDVMRKIPHVISRHSVMDAGEETLARSLVTASLTPGDITAVVIADQHTLPVELSEEQEISGDVGALLMVEAAESVESYSEIKIIEGFSQEDPKSLLKRIPGLTPESSQIVTNDKFVLEEFDNTDWRVCKGRPGLPATGLLWVALNSGINTVIITRDTLSQQLTAVYLPLKAGMVYV